ncbi:MAG: NAD(P)/FAD-dependent oxidoreductase [Chloroflexi bacterium]|nr:NAD(P)/FAD-dependent oxidoreductase [Chloroflexota bacterium]
MGKAHEIIIIGGGLGGLACGALLAKKGYKPLIVEMNDEIGGRVLGATEDGFIYDYFPIGLTPVRGHRLELLATELGLDKDFSKIIGPQRASFGYRGPSGNWKVVNDVNILLGKPDETPDMNHLFELWSLSEDEQPKAVSILADIFLKPPEEILKLDEEDITFQQYLDRMNYDMPSAVYNFLGFYANMAMVEPIDLVSAAEYIRIAQDSFNNGGGGYPEGSMMRVANQLLDIFVQNGGAVQTGTKIEKIIIEDGKVAGVRTVKGEELHSPLVISSAGIHPTVLKLAGEEYFEQSYVEYVKKLQPAWGLTSQVYFLKEPVLNFDIAVAYSDDAWWDLEKYQRVENGYEPQDVVIYAQVMTNYDPSLAPPGKQLLSAGTICPSDRDSKSISMLIEKTEKILFELWPEIVPVLESKRYAGPAEVCNLTRDRVIYGQGGECMGLGQAVGQSGLHRPKAQTPIDGLLLVGIDAGGVEGMGVHQSVHSAIKVANHVAGVPV